MTIDNFAASEEVTWGEAMCDDCTGSRRISLFARLIPIRLPMLNPEDYEVLLTLRGGSIRGVLFSSCHGRIYGAGSSVLITGNDIAESSKCSMCVFKDGNFYAETKDPEALRNELLRFARVHVGKSNDYFHRLAHPERVKFAEG